MLEEPATVVIGRMADFLSARQVFEIETDVTYDVMQPSGQMLQFGRSQRVLLRRPDRLYAEVERDDGVRRMIWYDGDQLVQWYPEDQVYGAVSVPDTIDAMLDYLDEELLIPMPLADLLYSDVSGKLFEVIQAASVVGTHWVDGVLCDHVAVSTAHVDAQLWIDAGKQPLPRKIVITYRTYPGQPQFTAVFRQWRLSPSVTDAAFTFTPPAGAQEIAVLVLPSGLRQNRPEEEQ